jgi:hypothetical protein
MCVRIGFQMIQEEVSPKMNKLLFLAHLPQGIAVLLDILRAREVVPL